MTPPDSQLSEHFSLREMLYSENAIRAGIENMPNDAQLANLKRLCVELLEPMRKQLGRPIIVNSGFRSPEVNRLAKGSTVSAHMDGRAADIRVVGMPPLIVCRWVMRQQFAVDKVIWEGGWTHLQISKTGERPRYESWTAHFSHGVATYSSGLPA